MQYSGLQMSSRRYSVQKPSGYVFDRAVFAPVTVACIYIFYKIHVNHSSY